jgi:hypothetical protein
LCTNVDIILKTVAEERDDLGLDISVDGCTINTRRVLARLWSLRLQGRWADIREDEMSTWHILKLRRLWEPNCE